MMKPIAEKLLENFDRNRIDKKAFSFRISAIFLVLLFMVPVTMGISWLSGCTRESDEGWTRAVKIGSRTELIGGPGALGEVGDFLLENDKIRVIIQGTGYSRGFAIYGGGLIDADIQRPLTAGTQAGGSGQVQFGELFPVFFLQALVPFDVSVRNDGSDGKAAKVVSRGEGGDFLTMTKTLNQVVLNSHLIEGNILDPRTLDGPANIEYETVYELRPGESFVRMTTRIINIAGDDLNIPSATAQVLLDMLFDDLAEFEVPIGTVVLFGDGNDVFAPGPGFDIRFSLQDAYLADLTFPAIPGVVTPVLATASDNGVSYAFFSAPPDAKNSFVANRLNEDGTNVYEGVYDVTVEPESMLMPFIASAFSGVFHGQLPRILEMDEVFEFTTYFSVGDGDVASALEPMYEIREVPLGKVRGRVFDEITMSPVDGASIVFFDADDKAVSQAYSRDGGYYRARLPAGNYTAVVEHDPVVGKPVHFSIEEEKTSMLDLARPGSAAVAVTVLDEYGQRLPSRITVVGEIPPEKTGPTREWLFDLSVGQRWRVSSMYSEDPENNAPIRYIEGESYTVNGSARVDVRPDTPYTVYVSRGTEYDLESFDLPALESGTTSFHHVVLKRTVDTGLYTAADLHMHATPSLDSSLDLMARVVSAAGEGLEFIAATDHNIITDYEPYIKRAGLERWLTSTRGVELTTLEAGHFNAYPLDYKPGCVVRGSPEWAFRTPDEMFESLRNMGSLGPEETIIQVNHPRDAILGYFAQFDLDPLTAIVPEYDSIAGLDRLITPSGIVFYDDDGKSNFSFDFNALEVLNGKRTDQLRSFRMPEDVSEYNLDPELLDQLPKPGKVLCNGSGKIAWPGAVDDWFNFLNLGMRYTVVGNSDSHTDTEGTIGTARSYVWTGKDDPAKVTERDIALGILNHRVILTNGPFVEMFVDGNPIGSDVVSLTGKVEVLIRVLTSNWIEPGIATLYGNARPLDTFEVKPVNGRFETIVKLDLHEDTWLVVEIRGDKQLFPIYTPIEIPPVELNDAFASIAEPFGLMIGGLGRILPDRTGPVTPYALTNPVWVDISGDGFDPPGIHWRECRGYELVEDFDRRFKSAPRAKQVEAADLLTPSLWFPRVRGDISDFRAYFDQFRD